MSKGADHKSVHIAIRGRVQGVGFRYWVASEAEARGLDGWVRNRRDASVEVVFAGSKALVDDMLVQCSVGPRMASVSDIEMLETDADTGQGFRILPTR